MRDDPKLTANGIVRKLGPALALLGIFFGLLAWQHSRPAGPRVTPLGDSSGGHSAAGLSAKFDLLQAAFNREAAKVRLLLLLDPT